MCVFAFASAVCQRGHHGDGYQHAITNYLIEFILPELRHIGSLDAPQVNRGSHLNFSFVRGGKGDIQDRYSLRLLTTSIVGKLKDKLKSEGNVEEIVISPGKASVKENVGNDLDKLIEVGKLLDIVKLNVPAATTSTCALHKSL